MRLLNLNRLGSLIKESSHLLSAAKNVNLNTSKLSLHTSLILMDSQAKENESESIDFGFKKVKVDEKQTEGWNLT